MLNRHPFIMVASLMLTSTISFTAPNLTTTSVKSDDVSSISSTTFQITHDTQTDDHVIHQLYHSLIHNPILSMSKRLEIISQYWLHRPYELSALGEGIKAHYDQAPRYRTDAFDCETYVDTVLALALATNLSSFQQCIDRIRYKNGNVSFATRNHFTSIDWNTNNQHQGFLKDVTHTIADKHHQPVAKLSHTIIDKANWYQHLSNSRIRIHGASAKEQTHQLTLLKQEGRQLSTQSSDLAYIPLTSLFDKQGRANMALFRQIPNASIIEIVRPNWDVTQAIGTHLDVSHLGFAFWKNNQLHFLQASSQYQQVVDVPLIDYLRNAQQNSSTIGGINIQVVIPQAPLAHGCS